MKKRNALIFLTALLFSSTVLAAGIGISNLPAPSTGSTYLSNGDIVPVTRSGVTYGVRANFSSSCGASQWVNRITSQGVGTCAQPTVADLSTAKTGTGSIVLSTSPILTTPNIGDATGNLTGNASTASVLYTPRTINGVAFDGSANITVPASAGTLTGSTLASGVTSSSLTSVGILTGLTVTAPIVGSITGNAATVTTNANLTGDVTSVGNATSISNSTVTSKLLTGYVSSTGTVTATDSILTAIQKLAGNAAAFVVNLASGVTGVLPIANGGTGGNNASDALANLSGVLNAGACATSPAPSWCSGSDVGGWINSAVASLAGKTGIILLKAGETYNYATTPVIPNNVVLDCQGASLKWTPTSGVAMVTGEATFAATTRDTNHKIKNCKLVQDGGYSAGKTSVAIFSGGDPDGIITPATWWSPFVQFENVDVSGFYRTWEFGNNTWAVTFTNFYSHDGYDVIYARAGVSNSGEETKMFSSVLYNNAHCSVNSQNYVGNYAFFGTHFDYNHRVLCGTQITAQFHGSYFEQNNGPFIEMSGTSVINIFGGVGTAVAASGSEEGYFYLLGSGPRYNRININGMRFAGNHVPPRIVYTNGAVDIAETYQDVVWLGSATVPDLSDSATQGISSRTSGPVNFNNSVSVSKNGVSIGTSAGFVGATAPINGLIVEGAVGIGTNNPLTLLHAKKSTTGEASSLIESSFSGGVVYSKVKTTGTYYAAFESISDGVDWRMGLASAAVKNFRIQDVTAGNIFPFQIEQNAGTDSIHINSSGNVGIGTGTVSAGLHDAKGKFLVNGGTAPTTSACGTSPSISGADSSFVITMGSGALTSCAVSFGATWSAAPAVCTITPMNSTAAAWGTTGAYVSTITTTVLTIAGANLTGAKYGVHCF